MALNRVPMSETMYRASRCCRILGNPTAYLILRTIGRNRTTPGALSAALRIHITTVSVTLRHLRQIDLVRYEARGVTKEYWVKDSKTLDILDAIETWVENLRVKQA